MPSEESYSEGGDVMQRVTLTCGLHQCEVVREVIRCSKKSLHGKKEFLQHSSCRNVAAIGDLTKDVRYASSILFFIRIQDAKKSRSVSTPGVFDLMSDLRQNAMEVPL